MDFYCHCFDWNKNKRGKIWEFAVLLSVGYLSGFVFVKQSHFLVMGLRVNQDVGCWHSLTLF